MLEVNVKLSKLFMFCGLCSVMSDMSNIADEFKADKSVIELSEECAPPYFNARLMLGNLETVPTALAQTALSGTPATYELADIAAHIFAAYGELDEQSFKQLVTQAEKQDKALSAVEIAAILLNDDSYKIDQTLYQDTYTGAWDKMISDETLRVKYWDYIRQIIPIQQNAGVVYDFAARILLLFNDLNIDGLKDILCFMKNNQTVIPQVLTQEWAEYLIKSMLPAQEVPIEEETLAYALLSVMYI